MNKSFEKLERSFLKIYRFVRYRSLLPCGYTISLSANDLNRSIYEGLLGDKPFMVCRFGSTEFENFSYEYAMRQSIWKRYNWYINGWLPRIHCSVEYEKEILRRLCTCSGFFPYDISLLSHYTDLVLQDIPLIDVLGVWRQENMLNSIPSHVQTGEMSALEPYDYQQPWSKALAGKKVLVVHPFSETIEKQYQKRELLWENKDVLPEFELKTIKAVQSLAGEKTPYKDWFEALHHMEEQMDALDYDIAIVGCGAYGFHLAAHAKRMGKKAVHLGGATQILFGIKGKRWDENPDVNKFYNEYWVYPSLEDKPKQASKVEGGCYW